LRHISCYLASMGSKRFYLGNFGIIGLVLIGMAAFADVGNGNVLERDKVNINFVNIDDAVIRNTFIEVFAEYDKLHEYDMTLIQEELKNSTFLLARSAIKCSWLNRCAMLKNSSSKRFQGLF
jgi:hypothetical protein